MLKLRKLWNQPLAKNEKNASTINMKNGYEQDYYTVHR